MRLILENADKKKNRMLVKNHSFEFNHINFSTYINTYYIFFIVL